jgi:hypothetical protein
VDSVVASRWRIGVMTGALVAAGVLVAPAFGAPETANRVTRRAAPSAAVEAVGTFTPAAADPRLAALLARGGISGTGFRFTPTTDGRRAARAVTVAVRATGTRVATGRDAAADTTAGATSVGLAPIAYNLGVALGWRRFALSGDVARVDLAGLPGGREAVDVGVSYAGQRLSGRVKAVADRATPGGPKLVETGPAYSLDLGASYKLTRNLDVTAGVRYRAEREQRLQQLDQSRESQAVYVGTAFRF